MKNGYLVFRLLGVLFLMQAMFAIELSARRSVCSTIELQSDSYSNELEISVFMYKDATAMFTPSPLKGTWVLIDVESNENDKKTIADVKKITKELYYTCPITIVFEEDDCTLYYDNDEEKEAFYYLMPDDSSIFFSLKSESSVPEKQFFLEWIDDASEWDEGERSTLQLRTSTADAEAMQGLHFIFHYELKK